MILSSCKIYRFTDASIDPNIKSFRVQTFPNLAPIQVASLSQIFTDALKQKFLRETSLDLSRSSADVEFSGAIQDYRVTPVAVSQTEVTSLNRLTLSIKVDYVNKINPDRSFSRTFTEGENYDSQSNLSDVEDELIDELVDRIVQSIFNSAFSNW